MVVAGPLKMVRSTGRQPLLLLSMLSILLVVGMVAAERMTVRTALTAGCLTFHAATGREFES